MGRNKDLYCLFDKICNTNLTEKDDIPEISSKEKVELIKKIDDAKAEVERLRILDIMKKVCK